MWINESMKVVLDKYLKMIPNQPKYHRMITGGRRMYWKPSNAVADWTRVLKIEFTIKNCDDKLYSNNTINDGD